MRRSRPLTELEGTVLGVIWTRQPCTPYQVRREFLDSPSPYWSGSAGAIYPLMKRLQAAGLVHSHRHATGSRPSRLYEVTPAGRAALQRWVGPPFPAEVVGVPPDPLRLRIAFLEVLPAARRGEVLGEIEARVREFLELSERARQGGSFEGPYRQMMARGAIAMQRTRLAWLRGVRGELRRGGARAARESATGRQTRTGRKSATRRSRP